MLLEHLQSGANLLGCGPKASPPFIGGGGRLNLNYSFSISSIAAAVGFKSKIPGKCDNSGTSAVSGRLTGIAALVWAAGAAYTITVSDGAETSATSRLGGVGAA